MYILCMSLQLDSRSLHGRGGERLPQERLRRRLGGSRREKQKIREEAEEEDEDKDEEEEEEEEEETKTEL